MNSEGSSSIEAAMLAEDLLAARRRLLLSAWHQHPYGAAVPEAGVPSSTAGLLASSPALRLAALRRLSAVDLAPPPPPPPPPPPSMSSLSLSLALSNHRIAMMRQQVQMQMHHQQHQQYHPLAHLTERFASPYAASIENGENFNVPPSIVVSETLHDAINGNNRVEINQRLQQRDEDGTDDHDDDDDDESSTDSAGNNANGNGQPQQQQKKRKKQRQSWEVRYNELKSFRAQHGHCLVPRTYGQLASFVKRQRHQHRLKYDHGKGKRRSSDLTDDREEALNRLGFVWDLHQAAWEEKYNQLVRFRAKNGHFNVSTTHGEQERKLAFWVKSQRQHYKVMQEQGLDASRLTPDRIRKLNEIGFIWNPRTVRTNVVAGATTTTTAASSESSSETESEN